MQTIRPWIHYTRQRVRWQGQILCHSGYLTVHSREEIQCLFVCFYHM
jgi:hypothetical protein